MRRIVLDASAVMTFLEDRRGAAKVEDLISLAIQGKKELLMSVVNWGEVYYSVWRTRGERPALAVLAEIAQLPIEIVDADLQLTKLAAEFRAQYRLPYADCFAASLALQHKAALATSDKDFAQIQKKLLIVWVNSD